MASSRRSRIGGRLRGLIAARRVSPRAGQATPVVSTKSLAVRPPWWRMAVQRLVGGLLPGFRAGSFAERGSDAHAEPTGSAEPTAAKKAARPLLARRTPLTSKTSVLRRSVPAPRDKVVGGGTAHLAMAPPPGAGIIQDTAGSPITEPPHEPHHVTVQREAASVPVPPARSLLRSPAPTRSAGTTVIQRHSTGFSGPVAKSSGALTAAAHTLAARTAAQTPAAPVGALTAQPPQSLAATAVSAGTSAAQPVPFGAPQAPMTLPSTAPRSLAAQSIAGQSGSARPLAVQSLAVQSLAAPSLGAAAAEVAERPASPEQRWRAAVASVPLESPKPFPTSMRPLVAQLTGSADGASYTTGPATRRALAEAGALGATTGRVVHLAQQPSADPASMGVLAHELTHARSPITRPRFMLHNHTGSMDSDERHARTVGSQFDSAAQTVAPIRVQRLFGGGGMPSLPSPSGLVGGLTDQATSAVGSLGNQATGMVGGLANQATSAIGSGASELSNAAGGLSERFSSAASGFANRMGEEAGSVSAGLIDSLPVGGGANGVVGAVSQIARTVVDNAVREATQSAIGEANQAVSQMSQAAQGMVSQVQGMATDGVTGLAGQANQWVNGAVGQATGAVQDLGNQAMGAVGDAQNAVAGAANQAMGAISQGVGSVLGPGAQQALSGVDLDRIAEALEERLLRQLERRGGRYAGVF